MIRLSRRERLRAVGPIWLMAVTGMLIGGALLLAMVSSLSTLRAANARIAALRTTLSTAWSTLHDQLTADRARFESLLIGAEIRGERTDSTPALIALFRSLELDEAFEPLIDELDLRLREVGVLMERASVWRAEALDAEQHHHRVLEAYRKAAESLRQTLQQLDGRDRLRLATMAQGGERVDAAKIGPHLLALPALVELLQLTKAVELMSRRPSPEAVFNLEHNEVRPSLRRLEMLMEARAEQGDGGAILLSLVKPLRQSLLGDAPDLDPAPEAQAGGRRGAGLLASLHEQQRIRQEAQTLTDRAHETFAACEGARQRTQEFIDRATLRLREEVTTRVEQALRVSWTAAGSAGLILLAVAVSLSRVSLRRTRELQRTLHDLRESHRQLVDIEQLREANRRSEQLNRELLFQKAALDQACIYTETDAEGRITYANDAFCALNGYSRGEILGNTHRMFSSGVHGREFWAQMYRDLRDRGVWKAIVCNRTKQGELYWTHTTNVAFRDEQGRLIRYASIRTNITEQIRAQQAQAELERFARATVDALASHIAILDEQGRIIAVNQAWKTFAASTGADAIGVGDNYVEVCERSAIGCEDARLVAEGIQSVIRGDRAHFTMEYACHSPTERQWFLVRVTRFPGEGPTRVVVSHENITPTRLANEQLKAQTIELNRAREEAEAASRAKSSFLAMMSHEIRTPLNGVVGALELLEVAGLTPDQSRYVGIARSSALALLTIINDILDFSKIEAGKLELSRRVCSPIALFEKVMELMSIRAAEKGLELICVPSLDLPSRISVDEDRLRQILINLIGNAIKFTARGSVTLRATSAPDPQHPGSHRLRVSITDTGAGIPADRIGLLFKPFSQTDATMARQYGGTGLGLAISRQLAEAMGGSIGVTSEPGRGSTFWFEIVAPVVQADPVEDRPVETPRRVLVVDDCPLFREWMATRLRTWGLTVETADDGQTAVQHLRARSGGAAPYDLIMLDHQMPGVDGLEASALLQSMPGIGDIPRVLMSSSVSLDSAGIKAAGFAGFLLKPVSQPNLLELLRRILGQQALVTPKRPAAEGTVPTPSGPAGQGSPHARILLAEDNEVNRLITLERLRRMGFECDSATNGREVVERWMAGSYDVVLMDCQMPEVDGFEATRRIRALERQRAESGNATGRVPIIALTANALKGDRELCLEAGMDEYVSKPIDFAVLCEAIARVTGSGASVSKLAA